MVATSVWVLTTPKTYRRVGISLLPALVSRGRLSRTVSCPRDYLSFFPRPRGPSLSPHSPTSLTFSQKDCEQRWSFKLKCHSNIRLPDAKTSLFPSGVVPACLPKSICMESTTIEGAPVAEGLPEETNIGDSRKNDRDRSTFITGNSLRVHSSRVVDSRQNLDAIQSN